MEGTSKTIRQNHNVDYCIKVKYCFFLLQNSGVWLVNIDKVDLSGKSYILDIYLWFSFDTSQINLDDVRHFEFINGSPTKIEIDSNSSYIEYRVKGDFITSFDFSQYLLIATYCRFNWNTTTMISSS